VRITDFGLAVLETEADRRREVVGTLAYMAPKQWAGEGLSAITDVYALGLILYEMVTGEKAFGDSSQLATAPQERRPPKPPSEHFPGIHPKIEQTILPCLKPDPAERPPSATAVMRGLPPKTDPVWREPLPPKEVDQQRIVLRRWKLAVVAAIGLLLVSLAGNVHLSRHRLRGPLSPDIHEVWHAPGQACNELVQPDGKWKAVWYELGEDGEYRPYAKRGDYEEPVEISVDGALFFAKVDNPLRRTPYFWYGRASTDERYCAVYFRPAKTSKQRKLIGVMYLASDSCPRKGDTGPLYLIGDWHGYCRNLDPESRDQDNWEAKRSKRSRIESWSCRN